MQNGPVVPTAFRERDNANINPKINRLFYIMMACMVIGFISFQMNVFEQFRAANVTQKNAFRFGVICLVICIITSIYLIFVTRNITEDRAYRMMKDYPIPSFTLSFAFVFLLIAGLLLFTDILQLIGIILYFAICVLAYNVILVTAR